MAVQLDPIVRHAASHADARALFAPLGPPATGPARRLPPDALTSRAAPQIERSGSAAPSHTAESPGVQSGPLSLRRSAQDPGPGSRAATGWPGAEGHAVPGDHPLRAVRASVDAALREFDPVLSVLRNRRPRSSMNMKWVLRGQLLMTLYGIESDRDFCAELAINAPFRWFLDLRPRDSTPDWWEFARERRSIAESVVGRCFLQVMMEAPDQPRRVEAGDRADHACCNP